MKIEELTNEELEQLSDFYCDCIQATVAGDVALAKLLEVILTEQMRRDHLEDPDNCPTDDEIAELRRRLTGLCN